MTTEAKPKPSRNRNSGVPKVYSDMMQLERRIMDRLAGVEKATTDAMVQAKQSSDAAIARVDIMQGALQRVEGAQGALGTGMTKMLSVLGEEREDGSGKILGTGLIGRVHRVENSVNKLFGMYRGWLMFGMGFCMAAGGLTAALWWVVGDKLAIVLKAH